MHGRHGITPKKRFGQHFLVSPSAIQAIVEEALAAPAEAILEIGPGAGVLTGALLVDGRPLHALELDPEACGHLRERFGGKANFHLREGDAVTMPIAPGGSWTVVGNLPYNAATAILTRLLTGPVPWTRMVLMFQREVGDKLLGKPGTKTYGPLSVLAQLCCRMTRLLRLGPGAFDPPPKVDSVVLRFEPHPEAPPLAERQALLAFLHHCFAHRRKTLLNNWTGTPVAERLPQGLAQQGLSPSIRAEALGPEQLSILFKNHFISIN
jgi:16S rRNA (adenine1518-N6/adenine1519-N6)-dimethyltransferase